MTNHNLLLDTQTKLAQSSIWQSQLQTAGGRQFVFGDGPLPVDLMLIGEAAGRQEDLAGKPFVGPAGQILEASLATINRQRSSVYITNIIKWRPPNNRDPLPDEKELCQDLLTTEIKLAQPKLIISLGRHASQHFLPQKPIGQIKNRLFKVDYQALNQQLVILPTYHPAACLYNPQLKTELNAGFAQASRWLNH